MRCAPFSCSCVCRCSAMVCPRRSPPCCRFALRRTSAEGFEHLIHSQTGKKVKSDAQNGLQGRAAMLFHDFWLHRRCMGFRPVAADRGGAADGASGPRASVMSGRQPTSGVIKPALSGDGSAGFPCDGPSASIEMQASDSSSAPAGAELPEGRDRLAALKALSDEGRLPPGLRNLVDLARIRDLPGGRRRWRGRQS